MNKGNLILVLLLMCPIAALSSYDNVLATLSEKEHKVKYVLHTEKKAENKARLINKSDGYFLFSSSNNCLILLKPHQIISWEKASEGCSNERVWLLKYAGKIRLPNYKNYSTYDNVIKMQFKHPGTLSKDYIFIVEKETYGKEYL